MKRLFPAEFEVLTVRIADGTRRALERIHNPAHPGELLREYLPQGMTMSEIAKRLGVTRQALSALLNGRAGVSAEMALRLSDAFGTAPDFWLRLQLQRDLWEAQRKPRRRIKRIAARAS